MSETTKKPVLETMHLGISFGGLHAACHLRAAAFRLRLHHAGRHGPSVRTRQLHYPDGTGPCAEGRHVFAQMTVEENLKMGAYTISDARLVAENMERVYGHFPRLKERRRQLAEDDRVRKAYLGA